MERLKKAIRETKNIPQIGSQLTTEDRLKILANLIVDRIVEKQKKATGVKV